MAFETFNRLVVLGVAFSMVWFGYLNFLGRLSASSLPSMTPLAVSMRRFPMCGVAGRAVHRWNSSLTAGRTGLRIPRRRAKQAHDMTNGILIFLMAFLFLFLGYLGVPVAFALIAGVLVVTAFTPVGLPSMMTQLFNGIDVEALLAVPFFLLVGELMTAPT